jgi:hypothetical protein
MSPECVGGVKLTRLSQGPRGMAREAKTGTILEKTRRLDHPRCIPTDQADGIHPEQYRRLVHLPSGQE